MHHLIDFGLVWKSTDNPLDTSPCSFCATSRSQSQQQTLKEARMKISAATIIFCLDFINCLEVWGTTLPPGFVREEGPYVDLFEGNMSLFTNRKFTNDVQSGRGELSIYLIYPLTGKPGAKTTFFLQNSKLYFVVNMKLL